jgi:hypothetical protein
VRRRLSVTDEVAPIRRTQGPGKLELAEAEERRRGYWPETLIAYLLGEIETTGSEI